MMDKVSLHGIDVYAHHGVHPAERELGQRFVIDVDLWIDCARPATSDSLNHALDYTAVHACINETTAGTSFHLIEALAGHLCRALLEGFPVDKVLVTVQKPNPPIPNFLGRAAVTFVRDRAWLETGKGN
ncbi:MAG: dihydroneopterin aldolase [Candidatus Krumholzibacteria bacterium]|nr:dihydroneopterin aldolase [Candidatus Krumholzibacteria bacterium]